MSKSDPSFRPPASAPPSATGATVNAGNDSGPVATAQVQLLQLWAKQALKVLTAARENATAADQ
jgi:hypothetical protein